MYAGGWYRSWFIVICEFFLLVCLFGWLVGFPLTSACVFVVHGADSTFSHIFRSAICAGRDTIANIMVLVLFTGRPPRARSSPRRLTTM